MVRVAFLLITVLYHGECKLRPQHTTCDVCLLVTVYVHWNPILITQTICHLKLNAQLCKPYRTILGCIVPNLLSQTQFITPPTPIITDGLFRIAIQCKIQSSIKIQKSKSTYRLLGDGIYERPSPQKRHYILILMKLREWSIF